MRSGLCLHSVAVRGGWQRLAMCFLHLMVLSFFYVKSDSAGIFRSGKSGLHEELVYKNPKIRNLFLSPASCCFPAATTCLLLVFGWARTNLTSLQSEFGQPRGG